MQLDDWINPISDAIHLGLPVVLVALSAGLGVQLLPDSWRRAIASLPFIALLTRPIIPHPRG